MEIAGKLAQLRALQGDSEEAAREEWHLRDGVLKAISDGAADPAELAHWALKTGDIVVQRWTVPP